MARTNSGLLEFKDAQKVLIALDDATSEVKKAVIIDADGVETDIQGVQPTGKKEITSTAEVNVANYATAQVVDEDLVAGNIKKDVDILGVVGSYEAGASDYSVATVTVINQMNLPYKIALPTLDEDLELSGFALVLPLPTPQNFDVVLKSGKVVTDREDLPIYSATGDIQYTEELLTITGDGSLTLADTM